MLSWGRVTPLDCATRTLPSAIVDVAASKIIGGRSPAGAPIAQGLVPRNRSRPPNGTTNPVPAPAEP